MAETTSAGTSVIIFLAAQAESVQDYILRAPSTARLLKPLTDGSLIVDGGLATNSVQPNLALLALVLASGTTSKGGSGTDLSSTIGTVAQSGCSSLLGAPSGGASNAPLRFLATASHLPPRALSRVRAWMGTPQGMWFHSWVTAVQLGLSATKSAVREAPVVSASAEGTLVVEPTAASSTKAEEDEVAEEASPQVAGEARGAARAAASLKADALRSIKLLLEQVAGGNKTD